jgi:glyoxylase-like metal-dependent hydrolase (beta-lactamase superfamily II)
MADLPIVRNPERSVACLTPSEQLASQCETGDVDVHPIVMPLSLPPGIAGPDPVEGDVRAFVVSTDEGVLLVDTGMDASGSALDAAFAETGADWTDVRDVVITHHHPDHTGALDHVRSLAPNARVWSGDTIPSAQHLTDGERIGPLRVVSTPGHTPGHISLLDESTGDLFVGDCVGSMDGRLQRPPAVFTADADEAERTLRKIAGLSGRRMLFAHGAEIDDPWSELAALIRS